MSEKYVMQDRMPERLKALQEAVDPATFRRIKALGLGPGLKLLGGWSRGWVGCFLAF
jgi:hypothetical protein